MWWMHDCEVLGNHDYSFLFDTKDNVNNIVAVGIFEKFDYLTMKAYLLKKA